jgi:hypothetical protein
LSILDVARRFWIAVTVARIAKSILDWRVAKALEISESFNNHVILVELAMTDINESTISVHDWSYNHRHFRIRIGVQALQGRFQKDV